MKIKIHKHETGGHILLTCDLNGEEETFIVDTGSSQTVLSQSLVRKRGWEYKKVARKIIGSGGYQSTSWKVKDLTFDMDSHFVKLPELDAVPLEHIEDVYIMEGIAIAGLLGMDLFLLFDSVTFDLKNGVLWLNSVEGL